VVGPPTPALTGSSMPGGARRQVTILAPAGNRNQKRRHRRRTAISLSGLDPQSTDEGPAAKPERSSNSAEAILMDRRVAASPAAGRRWITRTHHPCAHSAPDACRRWFARRLRENGEANFALRWNRNRRRSIVWYGRSPGTTFKRNSCVRRAAHASGGADRPHRRWPLSITGSSVGQDR
jgi:hypothetical protein